MTYENKSSAQLEREVEAQRVRVEERLGEIKERLSPGQLLDEALSYTKHGGAHFASNLGSQISANPIPATLVGVGLAWLISANASGRTSTNGHLHGGTFEDYPYANIGSGGLKRVGHAADDSGQYWSEFETSAGQRYKAKSDKLGNRASHFTDEAGKMFAGFIDETGNRVSDFRDEAGNMIEGARIWASHSWQDLQSTVGSIGNAVRGAASGVMSGTQHMGSGMQHQGDVLSRQIARLFDEQPLVAGALAFAAGAALGAALPHTEQEDKLLGKQGDKVRSEAGRAAADIYERGKEKAADLYEDVTERAGEVYGEAKDSLSNVGSGATSQSRH